MGRGVGPHSTGAWAGPAVAAGSEDPAEDTLASLMAEQGIWTPVSPSTKSPALLTSPSTQSVKSWRFNLPQEEHPPDYAFSWGPQETRVQVVQVPCRKCPEDTNRLLVDISLQTQELL